MIERSERERLWAIFDRLHDVTYFGREARDAYKNLGVQDAWARYFAGRAAPLGQVTSATVIATFYHFGPSLVERSLPQAWSVATPEAFVEARLAGFRATIARLVPGFGESVCDVNEVLAEMSGKGMREGLPLYSANVALGLPADPVDQFFMIATRYREHRGDCHNVVLANSHVSGPEAALLVAGLAGPAPESVTGGVGVFFEKARAGRGFTGQEWAEALSALQKRGLLGKDGAITEEGVSLRSDIEERTDSLSSDLYRDLSTEVVDRLVTVLEPAIALIEESHELPGFVPVSVLLARRK